MARPRKPTESLELAGAFKHNPDRRRSIGPKSSFGLGEVPKHLSAAEQAVWHEIVGNSPAGVLTSGDRVLMEITSRMVARMREDWLKPAEFAVLMQCLVRLGWTPVDRSRVQAETPKEASPFDEFLQ